MLPGTILLLFLVMSSEVLLWLFATEDCMSCIGYFGPRLGLENSRSPDTLSCPPMLGKAFLLKYIPLSMIMAYLPKSRHPPRYFRCCKFIMLAILLESKICFFSKSTTGCVEGLDPVQLVCKCGGFNNYFGIKVLRLPIIRIRAQNVCLKLIAPPCE